MTAPAEEMRPVRCVRPGCRHAYRDHAPGGAGCLYWFPLNGEHCECWGFQWVPLDTEPARGRGVSRTGRPGS